MGITFKYIPPFLPTSLRSASVIVQQKLMSADFSNDIYKEIEHFFVYLDLSIIIIIIITIIIIIITIPVITVFSIILDCKIVYK